MHSAGFETKKNCSSKLLNINNFPLGFSGPSANPGLEEIFLVLIFPLSLTNSHHTTLHWTERLEHVRTGKRTETASAKYYNLWRSVHFSERDKS